MKLPCGSTHKKKYIYIYFIRTIILFHSNNGFIGIANKSKCKPDKLWVDQGRKCYNNLT